MTKNAFANHNGDTPGTSWGYHGDMMTKGSNEIGTDRLVFQLNNIDSHCFVCVCGSLGEINGCERYLFRES